ncbi:hypothetical protein F5Y10DRAFT_294304 [Nemania abortiva]|nr:hypothetical protein F5Y10DRAFT_294304 [Nemania abortiva]
MPVLSSGLGLRAASSGGLTPNYAPAYVGFHFFWAYCALAPCHFKQLWGINHQSLPREDVAKYGEDAVKSNRITPGRLNMLKRNEAEHANSIENYTLLEGSMGFATMAGVNPQIINRAGLIYAVAPVGCGIYYLLVEDDTVALFRTVFWWVGNGSCLWLL